MVVFKNANYENFLLETREKRIICYGAGGTLRDFLTSNRAHFRVTEKIDYIFDRDETKSGMTISVGLRDIPIRAITQIDKLHVDFSDYAMILCLADPYIPGALNMLDELHAFNNMACYYGLSAISWAKEHFFPAPPGKSELPVCENKFSIPKRIHYIWFGDRPLGETEQMCIASWARACPDYEIQFWSEESYDLRDTPLYVRQAYEAKKYAFVSDYARLDILYRHGGFYLDTDVLLLRSLDDFTVYKAIFGYLPYNEISTGICFGSIAGNDDIRNQMNLYDHIRFMNDGAMNLTPCPEYTTDYFRAKGVRIDNRLKLFERTLLLPSDYLCALMPVLCSNGMWHLPLYELTENSYAIHKCTSTWFEEDMFRVFDDAKSDYAEVNNRLLADWKRSVLRDGE